MNTVFVRHQVANFDTWKPGFDEHGSVRREFGLTDAGLYRDAEDQNSVTILLTTDDLGRAREFVESPDLKEAMERLGVVSQPDVWMTNEA
jgi:hypothetical protein